MKKHIARALLVVALASFAGAPASADHGCNGAVTDLGGAAYVDDRGLDSGNVWVYAESNGVAGLQSGGNAPLGYADSCTHANPDTLLY